LEQAESTFVASGRLLSIEMMLLRYLYLVCMAPLVLADELKYAEQVVPQNVNRYNNLKDKTIALKTAHNQYIVAESNGEANANRQYRGLFEEFKV